MKIPLATVNLLNEITIAAPCPVTWNTMQGDDRVRHCGQCQKNVYDLSELTAAEVVELIQTNEGQLCIQLFRRADGTVITADCPVGMRWRIWNWRIWKRLRKSMAWAASLFALVFLPGCPMGGGNMRMPDRGYPMALDANVGKVPSAEDEKTEEKRAPVPINEPR